MTEAAIALHVTQPTLSRQISELEAELGTRLFTRTNRSTIPTEVGLRLRQRAEEILSLVTRMEDEAKDGEAELSGCNVFFLVYRRHYIRKLLFWQ